MSHAFTRRQALTIGAGALGVSAAGHSAQAQRVDGAAALVDFTAGARVIQDKRITLEMPEIVDTGNAVALAVRVESPMTEASQVLELRVFALDNRRRHVASFKFPLPHGVPDVRTRIRLEQSLATTRSPPQVVTVTAVAKIVENGVVSFIQSTQQTKVISGACEP